MGSKYVMGGCTVCSWAPWLSPSCSTHIQTYSSHQENNTKKQERNEPMLSTIVLGWVMTLL